MSGSQLVPAEGTYVIFLLISIIGLEILWLAILKIIFFSSSTMGNPRHLLSACLYLLAIFDSSQAANDTSSVTLNSSFLRYTTHAGSVCFSLMIKYKKWLETISYGVQGRPVQ